MIRARLFPARFRRLIAVRPELCCLSLLQVCKTVWVLASRHAAHLLSCHEKGAAFRSPLLVIRPFCCSRLPSQRKTSAFRFLGSTSFLRMRLFPSSRMKPASRASRLPTVAKYAVMCPPFPFLGVSRIFFCPCTSATRRSRLRLMRWC